MYEIVEGDNPLGILEKINVSVTKDVKLVSYIAEIQFATSMNTYLKSIFKETLDNDGNDPRALGLIQAGTYLAHTILNGLDERKAHYEKIIKDHLKGQIPEGYTLGFTTITKEYDFQVVFISEAIADSIKAGVFDMEQGALTKH